MTEDPDHPPVPKTENPQGAPAGSGPPDSGPVKTYRADLPAPRKNGKQKHKTGRDGRRNRGGWRFWLAAIAGGIALTSLAALLSGYAYLQEHYLQDVPPTPPKEQLDLINRAPAIQFFDRSGTLIASRGPKYGDRMRLAQLPAYVPKAFLAAEDRRFYQHGALDLWGIARAVVENYRAGRVVQGGSTLTQQLAKALFLTPDQTLKRKVQEAVVALRLARILTRDEVLELYLNRTYFGANTFGIDAASRTYFGKPASQLTLAESALLAALPKAPTRMALTHNMAGALARQRRVLNTMVEEGWITPQDRAAALADPPKLSDRDSEIDGIMGYALDYATNEVLNLVPRNSPDLMVRLTIDIPLQKAGSGYLRQVLDTDGSKAGASQGALLALSSEGAIRVMAGGVDYNDSVFNRTVQSRRQPGSSFKPFIYATALEKGISPTDMIIDGPVRFGSWAPKNYGGGYRGPVTVETALTQSINTVAVKLAEQVGGPAIGQMAARFGFSGIPANPDLSVALGTYEVPLIELVSAFQVFQNQGLARRAYIVDEIQTRSGERLYLHQASSPLPVYDPFHTSMMVRMMKKVITEGTGTRAAFGRPAAGKTGTSQNWRDAWFVGFTPDFATGVWVGNDDGTPMNMVTGGMVSAEIWRRFMITAHADLPIRDFDWLSADLPAITDDPEAADTVPEVETMDLQPRGAFYDDLSRDFDAVQDRGAQTTDGPETGPAADDRPTPTNPLLEPR